MPTKKPHFLLILSILLNSIVACNSQNREENKELNSSPIININIDEVNTDNKIKYSEVFERVKFVPLETNENCLIGWVNDVQVYNDTIYLLDNQTARALYMFDKNGKFIQQIGRNGKGPGEYNRPRAFTVDPENRKIQILASNKILVYSFSGEFVSEINLADTYSAQNIRYFDGLTYVEHGLRGGDNLSFLTAVDYSGKIIDKWFPKKDYSGDFKQFMNASNQLVKTKSDIKFMRPFWDTVFCVKNSMVNPYIIIETENRITSKEMDELNGIKNPMEMSKKYWKLKRYTGLNFYLENDDLIMLRVKMGHTPTFLYNKNQNDLLATRFKFEDDLTKVDFIRMYSSYDNNFVGVVDGNGGKIEKLAKNGKEGLLNVSEKEIAALQKLSIESNPVVVFYKTRKEWAKK